MQGQRHIHKARAYTRILHACVHSPSLFFSAFPLPSSICFVILIQYPHRQPREVKSLHYLLGQLLGPRPRGSDRVRCISHLAPRAATRVPCMTTNKDDHDAGSSLPEFFFYFLLFLLSFHISL
ncbi:hypothetical protein F5X99DRAFT_383703 [Biscogniauxia marginata]|nr:hypothetical protein F5X99DRAFT_383703 [Biscogniauxia marginata]